MFKRYWRYPIRKGWNYELTDLQKERNILCYGKPNSGKTEKVAAASLSHAIERNRSCIIFQRDEHPAFTKLYETAREKGYKFLTVDEGEPLSDDELTDLGNEFVDGEKVIALIRPDRVRFPFAPTNACNFIEAVAEHTDVLEVVYRGLGRDKDAEHMYHIILDGVDADFAIKLTWLCQSQFIFTVISSCRFLLRSWLLDQVNAYVDALEERDALEWHSLYNIATKLDTKKKVTRTNMSMLYNATLNIGEYLSHFQTIVCTGVDYVAPDVQKAVLADLLFGRKKPLNVGGRFIISELESHFEAAAAKNRMWSASSSRGIGANGGNSFLQIDGDNIEQNYYSVLSTVFKPGVFAIEADGRILTYFAGHLYGPVLHVDHREADDWLSDYAITQGFQLHPIEDKKDAYRYVWCDHEGQEHEMRFNITLVTEENVERLRDNFLISILEIEDMESRLDRYEKFYEDRLAGVPYWDRKLLAYFPESLEYFKLFAYTHKIEAQEFAAEEAARRMRESKGFEVPEEYRWKPYEKPADQSVSDLQEDEIGVNDGKLGSNILPQTKVLFMGGHQNMTKKLRQIFPGWTFMSDDLFREVGLKKANAIFFWTKHASHGLMQFVECRKKEDMKFFYVSATNIKLLIKEMEALYMDASA